jgi:Ca-activated chloride channel family protein
MSRKMFGGALAAVEAALFFVLCAAATQAAEPVKARMMLVFDASGSMWGQIEGRAKIEIAKEVMAELTAAVPADFETGLMVYGHRRKGDCKDIEMVIPVGPHDAATMKAKIQAISPKGKTPLSESVRQAAVALRYSEEKATVVLVSDGLETCDIDPCALAAELAMSGVDFTVHVIGFDIVKEDQARLKCLADKTGGLFLAADNAGQLRDALFKTLEEVKAVPPPVVEDPGTAKLSGPPSVPAGSSVSVQWEGPNSRGDFVAIAEKDSRDENYKEYAYTKFGSPAIFPVPGKVGDYELRYVHAGSGKVIGRADIKVTPVQATVQVPAAADVATPIEVRWTGPNYAGDYIAIAGPDQPAASYLFYTYTNKGSPLKLQVPSEPGSYEVRYIMGKSSELLAKSAIEIKGVGAGVEAPPVADVATRIEVTWKGPANQPDYIAIARPDQAPGEYLYYTRTNQGSPLKLQVPSEPGNYEVRYILGQGNKLLAKAPIAVQAVSASVQAPAEANVASKIEVSWKGPGNQPDYIAIARPDQPPGEYLYYTRTNQGSPLKLQVPSEPGNYEVRYILGQGVQLLAKTAITLKAVSATLQAPAVAAAGSKIDVAWQGPANQPDYISIARPDQEAGRYLYYTYAKQGSPLKLQLPSEPGTYEVRYILGSETRLLARTAITIQPVTASVSPPATAAANALFEVQWQGPGYPPDYIAIAKPGMPDNRYIHYVYTRTGNPVKLKAPEEAGTYEVRYIMGQEARLLDRKTITVK